MKKILLTAITAILLAGTHTAQATEIKSLPQPDLTQTSAPLMELLNNRQSGRIYDKNKRIDDLTLSEILWSAYGINKHGKRTIATARDQQDLKIYVLTPSGIWFYNAQDNQLEKISDENAISYTGEQQVFVFDAPIHLVYTSSDKKSGPIHTGLSSQNVYLYATSKGMNTVIRGAINYNKLATALKLGENEFVIAHQTIGYGK